MQSSISISYWDFLGIKISLSHLSFEFEEKWFKNEPLTGLNLFPDWVAALWQPGQCAAVPPSVSWSPFSQVAVLFHNSIVLSLLRHGKHLPQCRSNYVALTYDKTFITLTTVTHIVETALAQHGCCTSADFFVDFFLTLANFHFNF